MTLQVFTFAERPDLAEVGIPSEDVWPEYNMHGDVIRPHWGLMCDELPEFHIDTDYGLYFEPNVWLVHELATD